MYLYHHNQVTRSLLPMASFLCLPSGYTPIGQYFFPRSKSTFPSLSGPIFLDYSPCGNLPPYIHGICPLFISFLCLYVHLLIATILKFLLGEVCEGCLSAPNKAYQRPKNNAVPNELSLERRAAFAELACRPLSTDTHIFLAHGRSKNCPKPSRISEDRSFGHHTQTVRAEHAGLHGQNIQYPDGLGQGHAWWI